MGSRTVLAAEILAGRPVTIRIEPALLMIFDQLTRELLRTRPNPLTAEDCISGGTCGSGRLLTGWADTSATTRQRCVPG